MAKVNISKYPEGLQTLAKELELPIPEDNVQGREAYVQGIIGFIAGL